MIKIFIFACNRPDLLSSQIESLRKYLIGDYSIEVIYDYREDNFGEQFEQIWLQKNATLVRHNSPPNRSASQYHTDSLKWTYDNRLDDEQIVIF